MASKKAIDMLLQRFGGATPELVDRVLTPHRLCITEIDLIGATRRSTANFKASFTQGVLTTFEEGTTGKVVPRDHVEGTGPWKEVIKGRIRSSNHQGVEGELYFDGGRFGKSIQEVKVGDYLEVDPFGVTSKIESALTEAALFDKAEKLGFSVIRMPENVAKHVGTQNYYDFKLERGGQTYRIELKSLWGTDTTKARLIHTVTKGEGGGKNSAREDRQIWHTSSCRFQDQDIFAVAMWLRTGRIVDFAFALSVSQDAHPEWGLPKVPKHPSHVTQNPPISDPPSDPWTMDLEEACARVDVWRTKHASKVKET